ncbi:nuclease-like protein [Coniochaeta sp. 2T2.1]|nr:nuclease-like protein [Coniochaeta sp. 2T2.1]
MPSLREDQWINDQAVSWPVSEIKDCAIAIDATYYIQDQIHVDADASNEPLYPALGGIFGFAKRVEQDLDQWAAHGVTPFFVFDGQVLVGQDEISRKKGLAAIEQTNTAWELYFSNNANEAVASFGRNIGAVRPEETLYHALQRILRKRKLHFLVAPSSAAAQIAYLDMIDSDQCAGIMGSQELFLYPINDCVLRSINWESKTVTAISKKHLLKALKVTDESFFVDALLAGGTSFLAPFPALLPSASGITKGRTPSVLNTMNLLRATDKSVAVANSSFNDIVQEHDPQWLDKFQKARMAINHFIYIAETGEVKVNDPDHLTGDSHEYLGLMLPFELFHYLNTGLISPRILSWFTHLQVVVLPTTDGFESEEYKRLVETQTRGIKEHALAILLPALHRAIQHKDMTLKLWYKPETDEPDKITRHRSLQDSAKERNTKWTVKEAAVKEHIPQFSAGSILSELSALKNAEFVKSTHTKQKAKGIDSADSIVSLTLWRFLHHREYVNDTHTLTKWGKALATAMETMKPTVEANPDLPTSLNEQLLVAFELIRFDILNGRNMHAELQGLPMHGNDEEKASLVLISRCATLLQVRHQPTGYTGPLSKSFLHFRSLASEVRSADRSLTEACLASSFLHAQSKRERDDLWEISHRLPFVDDPDVALGIAVKTYFDDVNNKPGQTKAEKDQLKAGFANVYLPMSDDFQGDLEIACAFFDALYAGVQTLDAEEMPRQKRAEWDAAAAFLAARR